MATAATYTGSLKDLGLGDLGDYKPRLVVRPETECWADGVLVSARGKVLSVSGSGAFSFQAIPSAQLTAPGFRNGVRYVIDLALFDETAHGDDWESKFEWWRFTAAIGGGNIAGMGDGPPMQLFVGPPWPAQAIPGAYYDPVTTELGYVSNGFVDDGRF